MSEFCQNYEEKQEAILQSQIPYPSFISSCANFEEVIKDKGCRKLPFLFDSVKNEVTSLSPHFSLFEQHETTKEEEILLNEFKSFSSEKKRESEGQAERIKIFEESDIQAYRKYFRSSDWLSLLFILEKIRKEKRNGPMLLWKLIEKFSGERRLKKGKIIFKILKYLNLDEVMDMLIEEEEKEKGAKQKKEKRMNSLLFNMVERIE